MRTDASSVNPLISLLRNYNNAKAITSFFALFHFVQLEHFKNGSFDEQHTDGDKLNIRKTMLIKMCGP
jgi:hypothetical protein